MKKHLVSALIVSALFSANVLAESGWYGDGGYEHRHHRAERVVVYGGPVTYAEPQTVYQPTPRMVYQPAPQVDYRERVNYRERVDYRDRPVYYEQPESRYYADHPNPPPRNHENRIIGQAIGAVAGGLLGHQLGQGNARGATTAIGALLGAVIGGNLSD